MAVIPFFSVFVYKWSWFLFKQYYYMYMYLRISKIQCTVPVKRKLTLETQNSILDPWNFRFLEVRVSSIEFWDSGWSFRENDLFFEHRTMAKNNCVFTRHLLFPSWPSWVPTAKLLVRLIKCCWIVSYMYMYL